MIFPESLSFLRTILSGRRLSRPSRAESAEIVLSARWRYERGVRAWSVDPDVSRSYKKGTKSRCPRETGSPVLLSRNYSSADECVRTSSSFESDLSLGSSVNISERRALRRGSILFNRGYSKFKRRECRNCLRQVRVTFVNGESRSFLLFFFFFSFFCKKITVAASVKSIMLFGGERINRNYARWQ